MKKTMFGLAILMSILGTSTIAANPRHDLHHPKPHVEVRHAPARHHHHAPRPAVARPVVVRHRPVVVAAPRPVPPPRPVVVVDRRPDAVTTGAVVGGIIGGVIGALTM